MILIVLEVLIILFDYFGTVKADGVAYVILGLIDEAISFPLLQAYSTSSDINMISES